MVQGRDWAGSIASGDPEARALGTGDVQGVVTYLAAIEAFDRAVAGAMLAVAGRSAAVGGDLRQGERHRKGSNVPRHILACKMRRLLCGQGGGSVRIGGGEAGFEAAGQGSRSEDSYESLEDGLHGGPIWVVNGEGERGRFLPFFLWPREAGMKVSMDSSLGA
jgi:hypothetical protein